MDRIILYIWVIILAILLATTADAGRQRQRAKILSCDQQLGKVWSYGGQTDHYFHPKPELNLAAPGVDDFSGPPASCAGIDACDDVPGGEWPKWVAKRRPLSDDGMNHSWIALWDAQRWDPTYFSSYHLSYSYGCDLEPVAAGTHLVHVLSEQAAGEYAASESYTRVAIDCPGAASQWFATHWSAVSPTGWQDVNDGYLTTYCYYGDPVGGANRCEHWYEWQAPQGGSCVAAIQSRLKIHSDEWRWHHGEAEFIK